MDKLRKIDRALVDGEWFDRCKSTRVFADIAVGIGLVASAYADYSGAKKQGQIANSELGLAVNQSNKQNEAFDQLEGLLKDPSSFFNNPVFTQAAAQGTKSVARSNAAAFGPNSTNEATALQTFGQSFASQQLLSQEQLLAGMSGTQFNPAGAMGAASDSTSAQTKDLTSLGGLLSFFGTSGMGGGGTGAPAQDISGAAGTPVF